MALRAILKLRCCLPQVTEVTASSSPWRLEIADEREVDRGVGGDEIMGQIGVTLGPFLV
jgi:hypothetical protein